MVCKPALFLFWSLLLYDAGLFHFLRRKLSVGIFGGCMMMEKGAKFNFLASPFRKEEFRLIHSLEGEAPSNATCL